MLTKEAFFHFVDNYAALTESSIKTAENVLSVCTRVSEYIPDSSPADSWDIENIINRFSETVNLSEDSKRSYVSRLNSAVSKFISHTNGKDVTVKMKRKRPSQLQVPKIDDVKTFSLPIPLRGDLIVTISNMPRDLSKDEASRIANIVESFAIQSSYTKE